MKYFLVPLILIASLLDGILTFLGVTAALTNGQVGLSIQSIFDIAILIVCIVTAFTVLILSMSTAYIWNADGSCLLRLIWLVAVPLDWFTTFVGILQYITLRRPLGDLLNIVPYLGVLSLAQLLLLLGTTVLVSGTPMIAGILIRD